MLALRPDAVVINLSSNDSVRVNGSSADAGAGTFAASLNAFADLNASKGIRTIFMLEPNSMERRLERLGENHRVMREIAHARGVPVIEVQDYLNENSDRGFLWWDEVHLTSFGLRLTAERVATELERILWGN
jgi:hypothetical protein